MDYLAHWYAARSMGAPQDLPAPTRSTVPVRVVGGENTPEIQAAAERFHAAGIVSHWARRTGSDPEKIRAAMRSDSDG